MMSEIVSIGKRKKSKLEHIQSIIVKTDSPSGDSKDALVLFFVDCAERDGVFKEAAQ
jgi:hypothetical protein